MDKDGNGGRQIAEVIRGNVRLPVVLILLETIADFNLEFERRWTEKFGADRLVSLADRRSSRVYEDYPEDRLGDVRSIYYQPGFFSSLKPRDGAIDTLRLLIRTAVVDIYSRPLTGGYLHVADEKSGWVEKHLSGVINGHFHIIDDPTILRFDYLLTDNTRVKGRYAETINRGYDPYNPARRIKVMSLEAPYNHGTRESFNWNNLSNRLTLLPESIMGPRH